MVYDVHVASLYSVQPTCTTVPGRHGWEGSGRTLSPGPGHEEEGERILPSLTAA